MEYETLNELFFGAMETHRKPDALMYKSGGAWHRVSSKDYLDKARNLALGLHELGLRRGDRLTLLSENRVEWFFVDTALQILGVANVPIYATLPPKQVSFIIRNSESKAIIVSTPAQQAKIAAIRGELTAVGPIIAMDPPGTGVALEALTLDEVMSRGAEKAESDPELHRRIASEVEPEDLASIIYTSGTTGEPKGVMLTHRNFVSNVKSTLQVLVVGSTDTALSALPYAHVFERLVALYLFPAAGVSVAIAESVDTIAENLLEIRPTVMTFAPRLYEKMHARVLETVSQSNLLRQKIFWWSVSVGREHGRYRLKGQTPPALLDLKYRLATALVFKKLRDRVGGRMRFFVSGAAPLAPEIAEFFFAAGITILEGYGLTETSPVISVNRPDGIKFGTVGPPIPDVEVKIAEDGEILTRGPNVMKGYYKDETGTKDVLDEDGWFRTGDVGFLDSDGYLAVTDRKKDLIVTAGGKNIAPQPIENRLKTNPYIAEIVIVGNRRRFPSALIVPDFAKLEPWATSHNIQAQDHNALVKHPDVQELFERQIDEMTSDLAQFEKIKKIQLLATEFTITGGELTPTLKVKRNVIESRYRDVIDQMYR